MAVGLKVYVEPLPDEWVEQGGAEAFDDFYRRCHRDLVFLCRRLLCGQGDAEAIAQEAFLRAWMSLDRYSTSRPFWPWLATIARRLCIDHRRRLERERNHAHAGAMSTSAPPSPLPEEAVEVAEEYRAAYAALGRLKPAEQRVITLRDVNGWSYEEIARFEGVTVESIRGSLKRARTSLRRSYAGIAGGAPAVLGLSWAGRLRSRLGRLVARRTSAVQPSLLALPSVHDAVVGLAALVTAVGGSGAVAVAGEGAPSVADIRAALTAPVAVGAEASPTTPVLPGPARTASGPETPIPAAPAPAGGNDVPPPLLPPGLLDDGGHSPEATNVTGFTASPRVEEDRTVFASAGVLGCPAPPCAALFRSTDAGASWVRLPATGFVGGRVLLAPSYPQDDRVFVAGPAGLQMSLDHGRSFVTVAAVPGAAAISPDFHAGDPRIVLSGSPLWEYRDDTGTSAPAPVVFGPSPATGGVAFGPGERGHRLYVGGTSVDGVGRQVATMFSCDAAVCDRRVTFGDLLGPPSVAVSPDGLVLAWRGTALSGSADGGRSYRAMPLPVAGTVTDVAFGPSGAVYVAVAAAHGVQKGGLFASFDRGSTWRQLGAETTLAAGVTAVAVVSGGRLLAAPAIQGEGGVLCSSDHGTTWDGRCEA